MPERHRTVAKVAAGLLVLGVAAYFSPDVYDRITYGAKVGHQASAPDGGWLDAYTPAELAAEVGVPLETYSLARVIASEGGGKFSNNAERQAIGWAVMNQAKAVHGDAGDAITHLLTTGKGAGFYGAQNAGGRYASTRFAPRARDIDLASDLLDGRIADNTGGATNFFNPGLFAVLLKKGTKNYTKTWQDIYDGWTAKGYQFRNVEGVDPDHFVVASKAGISGIDMLSSLDLAGLLGVL